MSFILGLIVGAVAVSVMDPLSQLYEFMNASTFSKNALFDSVRIMAQIAYLRVYQAMNHSCIQIKPGVYELRYVVKGRLYSSVVKIPRGPSCD
jgi:hypothetical protein